MTTDQKLDYVIRRLSAIEKQLRKRTVWVCARDVKEITGWTNEELRSRRDNNLVIFEDNGNGGYRYDLESIPKIKQYERMAD